MAASSLWDREDLTNPGSRGWKKRFTRWVEAAYSELGVFPVVGQLPRPMCFVYQRPFATLLREWRNAPGEAGHGERWALSCSKAKFAVFVGSGAPELTWRVVCAQGAYCEVAYGFYIENGYEELPPGKIDDPFPEEGIDHRFFVRTRGWDWNRFRDLILNSSSGRRLVTDIMRGWDRPLVLRLDPADPNSAPSARRYWFDAAQLWRSEETSPKNTVKTTEAEMWDWVCQRADHKTAWFDVMLLEFARHTADRVDPSSTECVRLLLDALLPLLSLCWSSG
jgi:hypothetical protein